MRNDRLARNKQILRTPEQRAAEYLKRIARLTGAKRVHEESYWLEAGGRSFLVDYKFVRVVSPSGEATCFSVAADPDTPSAEVVASALLQLKNNPKLFEKWRRLRGFPVKANGKLFKYTDWSGWR